MTRDKLKLKVQLGIVRTLLRTMLRWTHTTGDRPGYSIVLGVPWMLRDLLGVNLRFVQRCDLSDVDAIHLVFDRPAQEGMDAFVAQTREAFGDLPLVFHHHYPVSGRLVQRANNASLFACMNWTLGIRAARTRYVVLHDFDLYPTDEGYFRRLYDQLRSDELHFTANELTHFDGLADADNMLGTWSLGIDADWLRNHFDPVMCFHAVDKVDGRWTSLDGLTHIETKTDRRKLCEAASLDHFVHVTNLCSVFLRYTSGQDFDPVWRLHMLWYLQHLAGDSGPMVRATEALGAASTAQITVGGRAIDFAGTHVTCGSALRERAEAMERSLHGGVSGEVAAYLGASTRFFERIGERGKLRDASGRVVWSDTQNTSQGASA